jgi:hypothetical protein
MRKKSKDGDKREKRKKLLEIQNVQEIRMTNKCELIKLAHFCVLIYQLILKHKLNSE